MQPPEQPPSSHPVDRRIVELVRNPSSVATPEDVAAIIDRMATAPFNRRPMRVRTRDRGLVYGHIVIGVAVDPLDFHLAKRVQQEEQWADATTAEQYLLDLRAAALHPQARVAVYERDGRTCASTITSTADVVPPHRRGADWLPNLIVVYVAERGTLSTGYMFSSIQTLNLPEALRWLR